MEQNMIIHIWNNSIDAHISIWYQAPSVRHLGPMYDTNENISLYLPIVCQLTICFFLFLFLFIHSMLLIMMSIESVFVGTKNISHYCAMYIRKRIFKANKLKGTRWADVRWYYIHKLNEDTEKPHLPDKMISLYSWMIFTKRRVWGVFFYHPVLLSIQFSFPNVLDL